VDGQSRDHVYLLLILELVCNSQYFRNVIGKPKFSESLLDVIYHNGLLCFLFEDLVDLRRYQRNELDITFDEEVSCVSGEDLAVGRRKGFL
jgi:hypothetical protein